MYRQHSVLHHHFGVARVALVQVEMMRAEAVKEELVTLVQYDYRHTDGELFSCVKPTLDECRAARDKWLTAKERKEEKR